MKKKREVKKTNTQKMWIGLGVVAVVAVALIVGLGALSIQPIENPTFGTATVEIYSRDGTQLNASSLNVSLYVCNYSGVATDSQYEYINTFSNYNAVTLNSSYFDGLNLKYEIKTNHSALLRISETIYFEKWVVLRADSQKIILDEIPEKIVMTPILKSMNLTTGVLEFDMIVQTGKTVSDLVINAHPNCSIPGFFDNYATGNRSYLYVRFDATADYTEIGLNITGAESRLFNGDLYIKCPFDLGPRTQLSGTLNPSVLGTPTIQFGYVQENELSTFTALSVTVSSV